MGVATMQLSAGREIVHYPHLFGQLCLEVSIFPFSYYTHAFPLSLLSSTLFIINCMHNLGLLLHK